MARTGYTRTGALGPISTFLRRRGVSVDQVFHNANLPAAILDHPDLPLRLSDHFNILEAAARETADPVFGASLGSQVRTLHLSIYGRRVMAELTLASAIRRANQELNMLMQTDTDLVLFPVGDHICWSMVFKTRGHEGRFQNELLALSYLMDTLRCYLGQSWQPHLVRVIGHNRSREASLETIFRAPVRSGYDNCGIEFCPSDLTATLAAGPPAAHSKKEKTCLGHVPCDGHSDAALRVALYQEVLTGRPTIDRVARRVGMTRRTLQRRLKKSGATYSSLLAKMRFEYAAEKLSTSDQTIAQISAQLGYSEHAHFTRAFTSWSGLSPQRYRMDQMPKSF